MSDGRSKQDLMEFLDFCGDKGLMNPQTAAARKASVSSFLSILDQMEASDVTILDLDLVTKKFLNLRGKDFKQESVKVYRSRVESSIRDFIAYKKDPLSFKPNIGQRERRPTEERQQVGTQQNGPAKQSNSMVSDQTVETMVFPIPIRPGLIVKVAGIPSDLTSSEARKISNVIIALAAPQEDAF